MTIELTASPLTGSRPRSQAYRAVATTRLQRPLLTRITTVLVSTSVVAMNSLAPANSQVAAGVPSSLMRPRLWQPQSLTARSSILSMYSNDVQVAHRIVMLLVAWHSRSHDQRAAHLSSSDTRTAIFFCLRQELYLQRFLILVRSWEVEVPFLKRSSHKGWKRTTTCYDAKRVGDTMSRSSLSCFCGENRTHIGPSLVDDHETRPHAS